MFTKYPCSRVIQDTRKRKCMSFENGSWDRRTRTAKLWVLFNICFFLQLDEDPMKTQSPFKHAMLHHALWEFVCVGVNGCSNRSTVASSDSTQVDTAGSTFGLWTLLSHHHGVKFSRLFRYLGIAVGLLVLSSRKTLFNPAAMRKDIPMGARSPWLSWQAH